MNCDAPVYIPATITVPAIERKSAQISSLSLLEAASTHSLTSLTVFSYCSSALELSFFLFHFLHFVLCFPFLCFPSPSSSLESVLLACSVEHLSFILFLVHHTSLQLLCRSLLLSSPSCAPLFHDSDCLLQLLVFFLPFLLHNSLGT